MKTQATIAVRVLVEVRVGATWGDDCTVGQVRTQGVRETTGAVARAIEASNGRFRMVSIEACEMTIKET